MNDLLNLVICVDDTDDMTKSTSTGAVAERMVEIVQECGGLINLGISRHQLLLDSRVNYTSHNSSMAFSARIVADTLDEIYGKAVDAIAQMKAPTADPGLCMVVVPENDYAERVGIKALIDFGLRAKRQVLTIDDAYRTAASIPWVSLTEHGGTGEGVIGALAGAGLRLSGCDGRFRGKWDLKSLCADDASEEFVPTKRVLEALRKQVQGAVAVVCVDGSTVDPWTPFAITKEAKPILHGNALTFVTHLRDGAAWPCDKSQLDNDHCAFDDMNRSCAAFEQDNDEEECAGAHSSDHTCANCLFRRWTAQGFTCVKEMTRS